MLMLNKILLLLALLALALSACQPAALPAPAGIPMDPANIFQNNLIAAPAVPLDPVATEPPAAQPTFTSIPTQTQIPTSAFPTVSPTNTVAPTSPATDTPIPTYVKLRGEVIVEHAACLYGPGAVYLYKYGLLGGSNLEIIGRNELGTWIEIQAIGGNNPCWVRADLMKIKGDVLDVQPITPDEVGLPQSPYYAAIHSVSARRDGNEVTVFWEPMVLKAGDDSGQYPYLIEAWVCRSGKIVFYPTGWYSNVGKITDEPGCSTPSGGRLYGVEKHGYTRWIKIPWPAAAP